MEQGLTNLRAMLGIQDSLVAWILEEDAFLVEHLTQFVGRLLAGEKVFSWNPSAQLPRAHVL